MIWVAAKFTDEHRAALDWLNDNTGEDISFFGLEIEVWRIGNSSPAPKFNIVCKPNDWSKAVKTAAAGGDGSVTPHKQLQFEFWTAFRAYEENSKLHPQKPSRQHWLALTIGSSGFHVAAIVSAWNSVSHKFDVPEVRVDFMMNSPEAKSHFSLKTPWNVHYASHEPERRFSDLLFENGALFDSFAKMPNTGGYSFPYSYKPAKAAKTHVTNERFNPDFFIKVAGETDIIVVEVKQDGDDSSRNRAKCRELQE